MSKSAYPEVIKELELPQDWRSIVYAVARIAPTVVLRAIKLVRTDNPIEPYYMGELKRLISQELFIQAIKYYREKTGVSLKEAKDFVDKLREETRF